MLTWAARYTSSEAITPKIMSRTSQAAPVWEPKNRDRRFSRPGECLTRMPTKTSSESTTATAKKSSRKPMTGGVADRGMWKSRWNRQPKASMMVRNRMVKPQKVKAWARPGTVHCSSFFCPPTSTSSALTRFGRSLNRDGTAGCPAEISRKSQKNRRPAMANITAVIPSPKASLRGTAFLLAGY